MLPMTLALLAHPAFALDFDGGSSPGDLATTPTAAIVLGSAPADIQLPGTPGELVADLGTAVSDADGIPDSFALEITPFWLGTKGSQNLDLRRYVEGGPATLARNFSVSAAVDRTATSFGGEDEDLRAAVAFRSTLWGKPAKGTDHLVFASSWDKLFPAEGAAAQTAAPTGDESHACVRSVSMLSAFSAWLNARLSTDLAALHSEHLDRAAAKSKELSALCANLDAGLYPKSVKACEEAGFAGRPAAPTSLVGDESATLAKVQTLAGELSEAEDKAAVEVGALVKTALAAAKAKPETLRGDLAAYFDEVGFEDAFEECGELLDRRQGMVVDFAGGAGITSFDHVLAETALSDWSVWMAPGWVARQWSLTGLVRLRGAELYETPLTTLDLGAGFGWSWDALTLGLQGRYGIPLGHDTVDSQMLLTADIRIHKSVWFATGLGAGFPADETDSVLSFLSIKFSAEEKATLATPAPTSMAALLAE